MNRFVKFITLISLQIPAIILSIFIFIHLFTNHRARLKPHKRSWCVLLLVNFFQLTTDIPMSLSYYYHGIVQPMSNIYCTWWTWYSFTLLGIGLFLMAWISVERHILIFAPQGILQVPKNRWLIQTIPLILCILWPVVFYAVSVVISPRCSTPWDFNLVMCGTPCYFTVEFIGKFDFIFNIVLPISIVVFANIGLILRLICKKILIRKVLHWHKHRKMTLQLWIISSLYMGFWLPVTIVQLVQITGSPSFMIDTIETLLFILYFIPVFLPILSLNVFPELIKILIERFKRPRQIQIVPTSFSIDRKHHRMTLGTTH